MNNCPSLKGRQLELFEKISRRVSLPQAARELGISRAAARKYGNRARQIAK